MKMIKSVFISFGHAWRGLRLAFRTERSFRLQIAAALAISILLFLLPFRDWERVVLLLAMAAVLVLELLNSMVERFVDLVKPRLSLAVRDIKDLMAAAVLLSSLFAAVIGALILWPYLSAIVGRV